MRLASAAQMKEIDRVAIEERGIPSPVLMGRAAEQTASEVCRYLRPRLTNEKPRVAVFCGPGNNGGDGVETARLLKKYGVRAGVFLVGKREKMTEDSLLMESRLVEDGGCLHEWRGDPNQRSWCEDACLIIDAILGIGLRGEVRGEIKELIDWLNALPVPILSVDIPSGISADTGEILGTAIRAKRTVTFTLPKYGHCEGQGIYCTGKLKIRDIGIPLEVVDEVLGREEGAAFSICDRKRAAALLPVRKEDGHKGDFGRVSVVGGSIGLTGAPLLAARGAARTGSGLVYLSVPESVYPAVASACLEVMPSPLPAQDGRISSGALFQILERLNACDAGLIGPGLGRSPELSLLVGRLLEQTATPLVLDADGLYAIRDRKELLRQRYEKGLVTVLTPHEGEFAYLGGDLFTGRREAAAAFARQYGCVLVLKGPGTVTASPDGRAFINTTGNNGMAKGGSGDVLGGMTLSFLGQGMDAFEAAALAVYVHGLAGDLCRKELGEYGMLPGDLAERIPEAILRLQRRQKKWQT